MNRSNSLLIVQFPSHDVGANTRRNKASAIEPHVHMVVTCTEGVDQKGFVNFVSSLNLIQSSLSPLQHPTNPLQSAMNPFQLRLNPLKNSLDPFPESTPASDTSGPRHVSAGLPEPCHVSADLPEPCPVIGGLVSISSLQECLIRVFSCHGRFICVPERHEHSV